ncbi:squamosa promoter-binding-like protein 15 [Dioscorea cayenensis subsp. rotundata]|uniref:Squamosa promoter-binding-like protein 15 n=1 Tax=Dioscorea cayennensis subsp. rotundata TaxID=55577 RepID=A0AB40BTS4_DIOCR|nr:squamosa promoter-binding-like protein 15 [Dioscorea cayenensis subsp. rotundata]
MASGTPNPNWNPMMWEWDSLSFTAKPSELSIGTNPLPKVVSDAEKKNKGEECSKVITLSKSLEDGENLTLKLASGAYLVEEQILRPTKKVRSSSPSSGVNYPICQVDDCRADLSRAKDYHRRHKVCEVHSKTAKALVGNLIQRFCQQCSRFHPLTEFDEGKRSCRRRLAGHNRRRRKTQPEIASSHPSHPGCQETANKGGMEIVNLLAALKQLKGANIDNLVSGPSLPDKDELVQILCRLNSASSMISTPKLPLPGGFDLPVSQTCQPVPLEASHKLSAPSTRDLLAVLSATVAASSPVAISSLSQGSSDVNADVRAKIHHSNPEPDGVSHSKSYQMYPTVEVGQHSSILQSAVELCERPVEEAQSSLPFQLFSSIENDASPKPQSRKYLSSDSSNQMEERSPSSSPLVVQNLFPLRSEHECIKSDVTVVSREDMAVEASTSCPFQLFKEAERRDGNGVVRSHPCHVGTDHSPSSSNSDSQDRTGRIIFKLFDKDPSTIPSTVRNEILNWLSHSPSEMESYIRPGCVVLSVYTSMTSVAWDELEDGLYQRVHLLLQSSDSDFWRKGRFLVRTSKQLVSYKDGRIRLCKSRKTWSAPELFSVSPVAVVSGHETSLALRGRNLTVPGTKIHCTYMGVYTSTEVLGSVYPGTIYNDFSLESFSFSRGTPHAFGRCFIEVENGFKGNSFPIIIADSTICRELRTLESEIEGHLGIADVILEDQIYDYQQPKSREDILHFLNELGWLFQRKNKSSGPFLSEFSGTRFKFLLTFSVERDWTALIKTLLDILVERSSKNHDMIQEYLEMLAEAQLLNRAVKRKCKRMVDLLLRYSVNGVVDASKIYLFIPNVAGHGGLTPLHLAASTQGSEDIVDALTNDPQEIGLNCWNSIWDDKGQSPCTYASMRHNHSYNSLVARKLADKEKGQVSIAVQNGDLSSNMPHSVAKPLYSRSCAQCACIDASRIRPTTRSRGFLQRPYLHSMLAIAAVCVCVCLFFRGSPDLGHVAPFQWENLDFGPT